MNLSFFPLLLLLLLFSCKDATKKVPEKPKEHTPDLIPLNEENSETKDPEVHKSTFRLLPVDESSSDRSLNQFVTELKEIVGKKDLKAFTACLDTGIIVSYGGGMSGLADFYEEWNLNTAPGKSSLWPTMKRFLQLGGAWENKKEFRIPYTQCDRFFVFVTDELDWYQTAVCIYPKTVVYRKPESNAAKTGLLSYEIVRITNNSLTDFIQIQTLDKKVSGFVKREQVVVSATAFPVIEKVNGDWKITSFAPYD